MRLIEEKYSIQLQIISIVVILFSTVLSQIANYKIDEFADDLMHRRLKLNELEQQSLQYRQYSEKYALLLIFPVKLNIVEELLSDPNVNAGAKKIVEQYMNGNINQEEMEKLLKNHYMQLHLKLREQIGDLTRIFNRDKINGSGWRFWRNYIFIPLQIFGLAVLVIGNAYLLLSISKRISKAH